MSILLKRTATPGEIAEELNESLGNVSYHLDVLKRLECIELVAVEPAYGGRVVEHFYRAVDRGFFDVEMWKQLDEKEKLDVTVAIMRLISEDVAKAMSQGTFFFDDDNHISRSPMVVDQAGWEEVVEILDGALFKLMEVERKVAERAESKTFPIKIEIIHFRSPTDETA